MRGSTIIFAATAAAASILPRQESQQQPLSPDSLNVTDALWDGQCFYPKPTSIFDLENYAGRWYQVAGSTFNETEGCTCIYAEYTLNDDGTVGVLNGCQLGDREFKIEGTARPADEAYGDAGVFRVEFPPQPPDADCAGPNYVVQVYTPEWAIVQTSNFSTLFLLSREQHPGDEAINEWLDIAGRLGTNLTEVSRISQDGCAFT